MRWNSKVETSRARNRIPAASSFGLLQPVAEIPLLRELIANFSTSSSVTGLLTENVTPVLVALSFKDAILSRMGSNCTRINIKTGIVY